MFKKLFLGFLFLIIVAGGVVFFGGEAKAVREVTVTADLVLLSSDEKARVSYGIDKKNYLWGKESAIAYLDWCRIVRLDGSLGNSLDCSIKDVAGASGSFLVPGGSASVGLTFQVFQGGLSFRELNISDSDGQNNYFAYLSPSVKYNAYAPSNSVGFYPNAINYFKILQDGVTISSNAPDGSSFNIPYGANITLEWQASWSRTNGYFWDQGGYSSGNPGEFSSYDPGFDKDCHLTDSTSNPSPSYIGDKAVNTTVSLGSIISSRSTTLSCAHSGTIADSVTSRTVTFNVVIPPPLAPSGLTATAVSSSQINLSWVNNSTNETGFIIERDFSGVPEIIKIMPAGSTSYADIGLISNTFYRYRVRATGDGGDSNPSNDATATTFPAPSFNLSASTPIKAPQSGASKPSTITVSSLNGFSSAVSLSASGLPIGSTATASFSPSSITPPANGTINSNLTINTSNTPAGTYAITVQGVGGGITRTATLDFILVNISATLSTNLSSGPAPLTSILNFMLF